MITVKKETLEYLAAENIAAPHAFTTRLGGVSQGYLSSLNLGVRRGDALENVRENVRILGNAVGFSADELVAPRQIHSDLVVPVTKAECGKFFTENASFQCDGLVTNTPGVALLVFTADCTPILLHDPVTGAVGAVHAGWRGTAAGIAARAVQAMQENYGSRPADIRAAIGPNIGFCHFQTDRDVPDAIRALLGEAAESYIRREGEKYYVDLKGVNARVLRNCGVASVDISSECTMCQPDRYWSHRVTQGKRGSQGAVIVRKEEGK